MTIPSAPSGTAPSGPPPQIAGAPAVRPARFPDNERSAALLVAIGGPRDVTRSVVDAAGRATVEGRPVVLVVVRAAAPLTINPVLQALAARRVGEEVAALGRAARVMCALVGARVQEALVVNEPVRLTRRARHRELGRKLHVLAGELGAELHPVARLDGRGHR